jgi:hypothetical protein
MNQKFLTFLEEQDQKFEPYLRKKRLTHISFSLYVRYSKPAIQKQEITTLPRVTMKDPDNRKRAKKLEID